MLGKGKGNQPKVGYINRAKSPKPENQIRTQKAHIHPRTQNYPIPITKTLPSAANHHGAILPTHHDREKIRTMTMSNTRTPITTSSHRRGIVQTLLKNGK